MSGGVYLGVLIATCSSIGWLANDWWQRHYR